MSERYVISLGGSLIVPKEIDTKFLVNFKKIIGVQVKRGKQFLVLPGGGSTARKYQQALRVVTQAPAEAQDWLGIETNRFHAHLVRWALGAKKYAPIMTFRNFKWGKPDRIVVAVGGIKPGGSSDSSTVLFAKKLGIKTIINLTNVDGVFDRDPRKFKSAKLIPQMTWKQFRTQFGTSRGPGQHKPFDSSVSWIAEKAGIKTVILNGRNLKNLENYFNGKKFVGTVIGSA
ncbi:MAG: UMP kinase [Candidatus Doudnabacteria bacterium]|nr:UMP kinase [Candidatus Doudnabacteria bacterium]